MTDDKKEVKAPDGAWVEPTENPFQHGCCDCGLRHNVEYCLVDEKGNVLDWPEGARLALKFERTKL